MTLEQVLDPCRCAAGFGSIVVMGVAAISVSTFAQTPPSVPSNFVPIMVDGVEASDASEVGASFNVLYRNGLYHLWYRYATSPLNATTLGYATSADGINFTTQFSGFTFATNPFPTGTEPVLYYEAISEVAGTYKMVHWTYNGGAGTYPAYEYNNSVSNLAAINANSLTHLGPLGGGTIGQTAGSFGIVGGHWYGQCGTGREICRAPYTDGAPPSVPATIYPSVVDAASAFTTAGFPNGYINNHGDIGNGANGLDMVFTMRDDLAVGNRALNQIYYLNSTDNGVSWSSPVGLITGTPTLSGGAFGAASFAHPELVYGAGVYKLYVSAQNGAGNYRIVVAGNQPVVSTPTAVPGLGLIGLLLSGLGIGALVAWRRRAA